LSYLKIREGDTTYCRKNTLNRCRTSWQWRRFTLQCQSL